MIEPYFPQLKDKIDFCDIWMDLTAQPQLNSFFGEIYGIKNDLNKF